MTEKDLIEYKILSKKVESLTERIARVNISIRGPRVPKPSTFPSSVKKEMIDNIEELENLKERYTKELSELLGKIKEIENTLNKVKDETLNEILKRYYIDDDTLEEICVDLGYSYRQIKRKKKQALKEFETCPPMSP